MSYAGTAFLLSMSGANGGTSFPDYSRYNHTVTASGDAQTSTAQSKFYGSSGLFDGTGDVLSTTLIGNPSVVTDGWRLRVYLYVTNLSENRFVAATRGSVTPSNGWQLAALSADSKVQFVVFTGSSTLASVKSAALSLNTWHHLEVGRDGTTYYAALDETVNETVTVGGTPAAHVAMQIGAAPYTTANRFAGHMQDFHIDTDGANSSTVVVPGQLLGTLSNQGTGGEPVEDDTGAPAERTIIAVPRGIITPNRVFATNSDASGNFSLPVPASAEFSDLSYDVWARDDDAGTQYNDLYFGRVSSV